MKYKLFIIISFFFVLQNTLGQDSLLVGKKYFEDQLYIGVTSNTIVSKPDALQQTGLSTGLQLGFIKDIPLHLKGNISIGVGVGYAINRYKQNLKIPNFTLLDLLSTETNSFSLQAIELPISFRYRTSSAILKPFFRVYIGGKLSYVFASSSAFIYERTSPIPYLNKWQYGPEISLGYGNLNVTAYLGQTAIFKTLPQTEQIDIQRIREFRIGLQFFIF